MKKIPVIKFSQHERIFNLKKYIKSNFMYKTVIHSQKYNMMRIIAMTMVVKTGCCLLYILVT